MWEEVALLFPENAARFVVMPGTAVADLKMKALVREEWTKDTRSRTAGAPKCHSSRLSCQWAPCCAR